MTLAAANIDDTLRRKALKLAQKAVAQTAAERGSTLTQRQINSSARILMDSDPKWIKLARAKMFKQAKPKQGGW